MQSGRSKSGKVPFVVMMFVIMGMIVMLVMVMVVGVLLAFQPGLTLTASAYRTHQLTSNSLIRISSPPVTCS